MISKKADVSPTSASLFAVAEREGFEPSVELVTLHSLSRRAPSADSAISPKKLSDFSGQLSAVLNPLKVEFLRYIIISIIQLKADG